MCLDEGIGCCKLRSRVTLTTNLKRLEMCPSSKVLGQRRKGCPRNQCGWIIEQLTSQWVCWRYQGESSGASLPLKLVDEIEKASRAQMRVIRGQGTNDKHSRTVTGRTVSPRKPVRVETEWKWDWLYFKVLFRYRHFIIIFIWSDLSSHPQSSRCGIPTGPSRSLPPSSLPYLNSFKDGGTRTWCPVWPFEKKI